ncbi:MAG: hypothetical protein HRU05_00410 [Oceanospirillaceae bacterium]|nr:hypothetical protein [Oceanospirillaceae bacterium]
MTTKVTNNDRSRIFKEAHKIAAKLASKFTSYAQAFGQAVKELYKSRAKSVATMIKSASKKHGSDQQAIAQEVSKRLSYNWSGIAHSAWSRINDSFKTQAQRDEAAARVAAIEAHIANGGRDVTSLRIKSCPAA